MSILYIMSMVQCYIRSHDALKVLIGHFVNEKLMGSYMWKLIKIISNYKGFRIFGLLWFPSALVQPMRIALHIALQMKCVLIPICQLTIISHCTSNSRFFSLRGVAIGIFLNFYDTQIS